MSNYTRIRMNVWLTSTNYCRTQSNIEKAVAKISLNCKDGLVQYLFKTMHEEKVVAFNQNFFFRISRN